VWTYEQTGTTGRFVQWGIISFSIGTGHAPCDGRYPTLVMRASYYKAWVESVVGHALP